jgi:hypothetical protein
MKERGHRDHVNQQLRIAVAAGQHDELHCGGPESQPDAAGPAGDDPDRQPGGQPESKCHQDGFGKQRVAADDLRRSGEQDNEGEAGIDEIAHRPAAVQQLCTAGHIEEMIIAETSHRQHTQRRDGCARSDGDSEQHVLGQTDGCVHARGHYARQTERACGRPPMSGRRGEGNFGLNGRDRRLGQHPDHFSLHQLRPRVPKTSLFRRGLRTLNQLSPEVVGESQSGLSEHDVHSLAGRLLEPARRRLRRTMRLSPMEAAGPCSNAYNPPKRRPSMRSNL